MERALATLGEITRCDIEVARALPEPSPDRLAGAETVYGDNPGVRRDETGG